MKKVVAWALVFLMLCTYGFAEQEKVEEVEPYHVFTGVSWGDSEETVEQILGFANKHKRIDIVTYLTYDKMMFGKDKAAAFLYFTLDKLTSVMFLFSLPSENFETLLVAALEEQFGEVTIDEDGSKKMWILEDKTEVSITSDRNSVKLIFENRWFEETE